MNPDDLIDTAPALLRIAGVEPLPGDLERMAVLLRRRTPQRPAALTSEPGLMVDTYPWKRYGD